MNSLRHTTAKDPGDLHYGRRVEADRSWTIYQVFTGVSRMTGLSRAEATDGMQALNRGDATNPRNQS